VFHRRKVKEKYGSDAETDDLNSDDDDTESDESEDEDGDELTPALDAAILRTLARIKTRDPGIYDADRNVFDGTLLPPPSHLPFSFSLSLVLWFSCSHTTEEHSKSGTLPPAPTRAKKSRTTKSVVTFPEHRLAAALDDVASARSTASLEYPPSPPPLTHVAEQAALRAETISAFHSGLDAREEADAEEEEEEAGLFTLREKTRDEVEREEAEYRAYLEREVGPLEKILDLDGEEGKVEDETDQKMEREEVHTYTDETSPGREKKKKKGKRIVEERKETDQEFLIKCVSSSSLTLRTL